MSWLEGLRERRQQTLIAAAAVLALVVLAGLTAWYALHQAPTPLFGAPDGVAGAAGSGEGGGAGGETADAEGAPPAPPPTVVLVHVAGAVVTPGVYSLQEGQRVVDAVRAAGGPKPEAALDSINLAQPLSDGQRLYVPTRKEVAGTPTGGVYSGGKPFTPPGGAGGGGTGGISVNPNTATLAELDAIPGIGPVLAERIIVWRTANGPFKTVEELTNVSGIGDKTLQDLKPYLTLK